MSSYPPPPDRGGGPSYPPPPGGPPWGGPGHGPVPNDNRATWALAIGIAGIVMTCCCGLLGIGGGIAAIVIAQQVRQDGERLGPHVDVSTATAAFWVGVTAIALGLLSMVSTLAFGVLDVMIP